MKDLERTGDVEPALNMNSPPSLIPTSLLFELLSMQPAELTAWLDEARVRRAVPAGFNWRGLAFAAAAEARRAGAAGAVAEALARRSYCGDRQRDARRCSPGIRFCVAISSA